MLDRRTFLTGIAGLLSAPAIVRAGSLDFVPRGSVLVPAQPIWRGIDIGSRDSTGVYLYRLTFQGGKIIWEAETIERMHRA